MKNNSIINKQKSSKQWYEVYPLKRGIPFHLTKLLSPVPLFCILLTRTITKRGVAWAGSVQPSLHSRRLEVVGARRECAVPLGTRNCRNFITKFLLNGKRPFLLFLKQLLSMLSHLSRGLYQQRLNVIVLSTFPV